MVARCLSRLLCGHNLRELFETNAESVLANAAASELLGCLLHDSVDHSSLSEEVSLTEFTFTVENFCKVLLGDETRIIDIKVMESELQVLHSEGLPTVNCSGKELAVIYQTVSICI